MILEQNKTKIKYFIRLFIVIQIIIISTLYLRLDYVFNRKRGNIQYLKAYFAADFIQKIDPDYSQSEYLDQKNQIIASRNGVRFYYQHCPGLNRIREENKVFFNSEKEAEDAGYTIANNCSKQ